MASIRRSAPRVSLLLLLLSALLLLSVPIASRASKAVDFDEEDFWWDAQEYTELWNFVEARRWAKAIARVRSHPDEASVLVLRRERTGKVIEKSLPLHKAFAVDVAEDARDLDLPPADGLAAPAMPSEQAELIELLLEKHPDAAKVTDAEKRLTLHVAAYSSISAPPSVLASLIRAYPGALKRKDGTEKLPLHAACSAPLSSYDLIRALADARPESVQEKDKDGALPIHLASYAGSRRGPETARAIEFLHSSHPDSIRAKDKDGDTPLAIMVKYGRISLDAVEYVLRVDPDGTADVRVEYDPDGPVEIKDMDGDTVLHGALAGPGHDLTANMVRRMLDVRPDLVRISNGKGKLPIHTALDHCCTGLDVVKVLVGAFEESVRVKDKDEKLPLHHACWEAVDDPAVVKFLLELYPDSAKEPSGDGALPLHLAINALSGQAQEDERGIKPMDYVVSILADAHPAAASMPDPRTDVLPLHAALRKHKSPMVIRKLIDVYLDAIERPVAGANNATVLHVLAEEREEYHPDAVGEIAAALLASHPGGAAGADDDGRLPLHAACMPAEQSPRRRRERIREAASWNVTAQQVLLEELLRAHPDGARAKDGEGNLPLHYSCKSHDADVALALLEAYPDGARVRSDGDGLLPLQLACGATRPKYERYERGKAVDTIVKKLLELYPEGASSGSEESVGGGGGGLPLHLVSASTALSQHLTNETVLALIAAYPDAVRTTDGEGDLPLHNAIRNRPHDTGKSTVLIRSLLREYPEAASMEDRRGNLPLHTALMHARGGSATSWTYRRIAKILFDAYPAAAGRADSTGSLPAHKVARIVGETGGIGKDVPGWVALFREVVEAHGAALTEGDNHGRTPLHGLCFALSDAVSDLADAGKAPKTSSGTMEGLFRFLLSEGPDALGMEDHDEQRPRDLVRNDRRLGHMGEDLGEMSPTFTALKREVMRGSKYWKAKAATATTAESDEDRASEEEPRPKTGSDEL